MNVTDFEQRRNKILEVVIEAYITTASPVGSALISRRIRPSLSPATIRNIMVELEESGFLEQPHTSAGRVPTDLGYRFYVNTLMEVVRVSAQEMSQLARLIHGEALELTRFFSRVCQALPDLSHQAAFVIAPTVKRSTIRQIELLPLGVHKLLCVLIGQEALIASHVVELKEPISRDEALSLAHFLNTELSGLPAQELVMSLERRLLAVNDSFYHLIKRSLGILQTALAVEPEEQWFLEGAAYLFEQPEFRREPEKVRLLLQCLAAPARLIAALRQDLEAWTARGRGVGRAGQLGPGGDATSIRIGQEVPVEGLDDVSYVLAPFVVNETTIGGVGVLGPRRMDYRRMCALVEGATELVEEELAHWQLEGSDGDQR